MVAKNKPVIELLTKEQVAQRLNMSIRTVYRMAMAGEMPAPVRAGRSLRWRSDVLDAWIENDCKPLPGRR